VQTKKSPAKSAKKTDAKEAAKATGSATAQVPKKLKFAAPSTNPFIIPNTNRVYANPKKWKIARDILERYTGSPPERFRKQIILTNFDYYIERFDQLCGTERTKGSAMTAVHSDTADVSIIDFSIGSPTAALIIEVLPESR
jgi:AMP nucleosidase